MKKLSAASLLVATLLLSMVLTGCSSDSMELVNNTTTNKDDEVVALLKTVPGVTDVKRQFSEEGETFYFFNFLQQATHNSSNSYQATFKQKCYLHYVNNDAPIVLHTQGYLIGGVDDIGLLDLSTLLNANVIEVEHRYFGESWPESPTDLGFNFLSAEEAAGDLHAIVSAFKQSIFPKNKWVATGASKGGINSALYAYFNAQNGWSDMDLYVPFCAPFLTGTEDSPLDLSTGTYINKYCGKDPTSSAAEVAARQRLDKFPTLITDNPTVRNMFINYLKTSDCKAYKQQLANYLAKNEFTTGNLDKDLVALAISSYYTALFNKFSYLPFHIWAPYVPDPDHVTDSEENMEFFRMFVFWSNKELSEYIKNYGTQQESQRRAPYNDFEVLEMMDEDNTASYDIQSVFELGVADNDFSALATSTYITPAEIEKVHATTTTAHHLSGTTAGCHNYTGSWDGGKLMTDFRKWVSTQTTTPMLFVYGNNDPWTGGRIDDPVSPATSKVKIFFNPRGTHTDSFLNKTVYDAEVSKALSEAIMQNLGL